MLKDEIPKIIGGANALFVAKSEIGFDFLFRNNIQIRINYISICQYNLDEGYYLFGCDEKFNTHSDYFFDNIEEAKDDAKRIYKTNNIIWSKIE